MSTMTKEELLDRAIEIRDEKDNGDNTAQRVGELLCGIVEKLDPELPGYLSYNIIPTPSSLQFGVDTTTNLYIPSSFTIRCVVEKQEENINTTYEYNSETGELAVDGYILYYKTIALDGTESNYTKYTGSIIVGSGDGSASSPIISVNLYLASSANGTSIEGVVRQVNIPVLRGGKARIGEKGEDAIRINMDNEMDAIPCNSEKTVTSLTNIKTTISVYKGAALQTENVSIEDWDVGEIEIEGGSVSGVVTERSSGIFEILWTLDEGDIVTRKKYQIPITVHYNDTQYKVVFIVITAEGVGTIQLMPNPTQIVFASDETQTTKFLKLSIQKKEGNDIQNISVLDSGLNVRYSLTEMPAGEEDGASWLSLPVTGLGVTYNSGNNIYLAAFDGSGNLIDRETVSILHDGKDGTDGNLGRFYYYAGEWGNINNSSTLPINDNQAPYISYNGEHYMSVAIGNTSQIWEGYPNENGYWAKMESLDYVISKAIFSDYAELGSFIIIGDWMISQQGTINGVYSTTYTAFNPEHPNDNTGTNFIPNFAIDGKTGNSYQNNTYITGGIFVDKVSKIVQRTWVPGAYGTGPTEDPKTYYLYTATEGEHIYECDHIGSPSVHRDYYSVGKITLKSNYFFILASGINDSGTTYSNPKAPLHIVLPNPKYCIGQTIIITNKSTGFPPNSLLLEQEYVHYNGPGPREDGQGGTSEHYVCMTAKELLNDYPMYPNWPSVVEIGNPYKWNTDPATKEGQLPNDWTFKDGEPVLGDGSAWEVEGEKLYTAPSGNSSINGIWMINDNNYPTILKQLDLNEYEWIELVAVGWNITSKSSINPSIINTYFSDFYTQWVVTRWKEKTTS